MTINTSAGAMRAPGGSGKVEKPITGRTVLFWILGFFGVIFAANGAFLYFAYGSFPGTVVDSSYKAGLAFNGEVAAAKAQADRGWQVAAHLDRSSGGAARITVSALEAGGVPVAGVSFVAKLSHPTAAGLDQTVTLNPLEDGRYTGVTPQPLAPGNWNMVIEAEGGEGRLFRSENRVFLKD